MVIFDDIFTFFPSIVILFNKYKFKNYAITGVKKILESCFNLHIPVCYKNM